MNALPLHWPHPPGHRVPWLLLAAFAGAVLDLAMAVLFWAGEGVAPIRIPQSIAAWFLGAAAYRGGPGTALLGVVAYVLLAWAMARAYVALARRRPVLVEQPFVHGALYGMACYLVTFHLLVPLLASGAAASSSRPDWILACLAAYAGMIGIPIACAARRVLAGPAFRDGRGIVGERT